MTYGTALAAVDREAAIAERDEFGALKLPHAWRRYMRTAGDLKRPGDPSLPLQEAPWAFRQLVRRVEEMRDRERADPRREELIISTGPQSEEARYQGVRVDAWGRFFRENMLLRGEMEKHPYCLDFLQTTREFVTRFAAAPDPYAPPRGFSLDYEHEHHKLCERWKALDADDKARLPEFLAERRAKEAAASMEQRLRRVEEQVAALIKQSR